jgi:hypothetical protein
MSIKRWFRLRQLRKRRKFISCLREANRNIQAARLGLEGMRNYQPICMGGMEDKMAGEDQFYGQLRYWGTERHTLARRLRMDSTQAAHYT